MSNQNLDNACHAMDRILRSRSFSASHKLIVLQKEMPILKQYFYNNDGPILEPGSVVTTNGEPRPVLLPKYNLSTIEKAQMFDRLLGVIHGFRALRIGFYEAVDPELSDYIITGYDSKGDEYTLGHTKSFEKGIEALEKTLVLLDIKCPEAVARDQLFNKAMNKTFETHGESLKKLED